MTDKHAKRQRRHVVYCAICGRAMHLDIDVVPRDGQEWVCDRCERRQEDAFWEQAWNGATWK